MLNKSKSSALILSAVGVLTFAITSALLNLLLPVWTAGESPTLFTQSGQAGTTASILGVLAVTGLVLAVLIVIGWFWIDRFFGARYYGRSGAFFWALFGFLLAVFISLPDWFFARDWMMVQRCWRLGSVFPAFFLARWLSGITRT